MRRLLLAFALFSTLAGAAPKRPPIPSLGVTIDVNIVNVDVVVTDKSGRRVRGLTKADFVLLENGAPREISNFAEYASLPPREDEAAASTDAPPRQPRTLLVFIERETKLAPFDAERFIESLRATVHNTIREGDAVGVVIWDFADQVRVDFTGDLAKIDLVLDAIAVDLTGAQRRTPDQLVSEVDDIMNFELEIAARAAELDIPYSVSDRSIVTEHVGTMNALTQLTRMKRKVNAINAAIDSMASAEGKKVLLLATHRLGEVAGGDFYFSADDTEILSQDVRSRFQTRDLIDSIIRNANAAGVTIYPVYPTGRRVDVSAGASEYQIVMNEMQSLRRIASQTGGIEAAGATEIVNLLRRVEDDMSDYYSLAYRIESSRDDRRRELVVKTKDPSLTVRARRSYVEKSDETRMRDRLLSALVRTSNDSMFPIEAQLGAAKKQRGSRGQVPLQVRIPIGALTVVPENGVHVGVFSVFVMSGAGGDEVSDLRQQTQRFEIPGAELAKAVSGHFTYELDLVMNEKADRVAIGVLDEVSKSYAVLRLPVTR